ncbi:LemA family protein [Rhodoferax aquaticus]|uniref:LemA family protein n=1 Tax=Rhodoferax aquaticus TaxID=2527691 RepID=A0A515EU90_9BURK|nr:LemA family protein [Rhodoferax aquaticus]QDL56240.1 hypothetical protein EXZ61_19905 [Rhodoferax aquaticus]
MTGPVVLWMFAAVCMFWAIGAYNRLVRLRARGADAWGSMEKQMRKYLPLVLAHLNLTSVPEVPDPSQLEALDLPLLWHRLLKELLQLEQTLRATRHFPLKEGASKGLKAAFDSVLTTWNELCCAPGDLAGAQVPFELHQEWDAITEKTKSSVGGLNQILERYNEAIHQFPASLIAQAMRFHSVEKI